MLRPALFAFLCSLIVAEDLPLDFVDLNFVEPLQCSELRVAHAKQVLNVPVSVTVPRGECALVTHRSSENVWNYDVPPTPFGGVKNFTLCNTDDEDQPKVFTIEARVGVHELRAFVVSRGAFPFSSSSTPLLFRVSGPGNTSEEVRVWRRQLASRAATLAENQKEIHKRRKFMHTTAFPPSARQNLDLYESRPEYLHPQLREALASVREGRSGALSQIIRRVTDSGVFGFPLFTESFCEALVQEIDHVNTVTAGHDNLTRPNSMNRYGIVLDEIGMGHAISTLMEETLRPITRLLFPHLGGDSLHDHHAFAVRYKVGGDEDLDMHMDESDVTLNVNLGKVYDHGEVYFRGLRDHPSANHGMSRENANVSFPFVGSAIIHAGQHFHGARRITSGERVNFIIWMRSDSQRTGPVEHFMASCLPGDEQSATSGNIRDEL